MTQKLVIVESPAKAKTINKYLGADYKVLASFGHIRDLPAKDGSVLPEQDFAMSWELGDRAQKHVTEITKAAKAADSIYLALDPDREGEAIAWHVQEILKEKNLLKNKPLQRIAFNEITKKTVLDALAHPRDIDKDLVDAYLARRALDYLVGFSLSPVLWRKLPGARSAGRVQSVALRLIAQRESEIEDFKTREYWNIEGLFKTKTGEQLSAMLTHFKGEKLDKFALGNEAQAIAAQKALEALSYKVDQVEKKQSKRNPYPPFTTSTLQQEASRRLGLGATRTMRLAQQLYEGVDIAGDTVGLITYMRTDGVSLSSEAIEAARQVIGKDFGSSYLPPSPRLYKAKAKNAQEAHEAIRPTNMNLRPQEAARYLETDMLRLYTLIWQRTMASQMANAVLDQVAVDITAGKEATFRATGSTIVFDGWFAVYQDTRDEDLEQQDDERRLPAVAPQDPLTAEKIAASQHFTQPPPRYTEASLVKKLEELGIGRPSTYASIMQVLQERDYVKLEKKRFIPEDRGRIVTAFLEKFFGTYVEYDFTADLEEELDNIAEGKIPWRKVMQSFWHDFSAAIEKTKDLKITDVINELDEALGPHFFPAQQDGSDPRLCALCGGRMGLKLGKFGAFIGCSNYPTCRNTRPLVVTGSAQEETAAATAPRQLGHDPKTGMSITVRVGPYGAYVQLDQPAAAPAQEDLPPEINPKTGKPKRAAKKKKEPAPKPKRVSLPKGMDSNFVDLETALKLLALPREIGRHPQTGEMITADIGRYGPYIKMGTRYKSLEASDNLLTVGLDRAVDLLAQPEKGRRVDRMTSSARVLGEHPKDNKPITIQSGRFGPYVKWGKVMATVTKAYDPANLTLDEALALIEAKLAKAKK
ncbi:MAG: type I DNA topoisomerase [Alphaproteobacteria bacterium]|nr:type I DNA topoisomerase [Alphaproteobacteria bacterium]